MRSREWFPRVGRIALVVLLGCLHLLPATRAQAHTSGQGFLEARASAFVGAEGQSWQAVQRLRPTLQLRVSERANLVVAVEAGLAQGRDLGCELRRTIEDSVLGQTLESAGCHWPDRGHDVLRVHASGDYLEVDRLYLDLYRSSFDVRIGRQSLHWGSAQFFNPSDPFPEVLLAEPWRPRRGINSIRATVPLGSLNDLTTVVAVDDSLHHVRMAARLRLDVMGTGLAVIGAWRADTEDGLVGLDLRGTNIVGWWLEAALVPGTERGTELAIGVDYSFPVLERMLLFAQYYRSGSGATRPDEYARGLPLDSNHLPVCGKDPLPVILPGDDDSSEGVRSRSSAGLVGRDYLLLGSMIDLSPDLSFKAFLLQNLNDGTALGIPTLSYLARASLELSISAQLPLSIWGEGGELRPRQQDLRFPREPQAETETPLLDLSGLVPTATITLWARRSF